MNNTCDDSPPCSSEQLNVVTWLCRDSVFNDFFCDHPDNVAHRKLLFEILQTYLEGGHDLVLVLAQDDIKNDLIWDFRRRVVKNIGTEAAALNELEFTTNIINKDATNGHAWSHRQWVFQTFGRDWGDEDELAYCANILEDDTYNCFAWDQVAERFISAMDEFKCKNPPTPMLISYNPELIRKQAAASTRRFEEGNPLSVLDGIFIAIKDDIDCCPHPSKGGTTFFHVVRPVEEDAATVARLRSCGVFLVGKANMHELGLGTTGNTPNHGKRVKFIYDTRTNLALFQSFSASDYVAAQRLRRRFMYYHMEIFKKVDMIVTPTTGMTAPVIHAASLSSGQTNLQVSGWL